MLWRKVQSCHHICHALLYSVHLLRQRDIALETIEESKALDCWHLILSRRKGCSGKNTRGCANPHPRRSSESESHVCAYYCTFVYSGFTSLVQKCKNENILHVAKAKASPRDLKTCVVIWEKKIILYEGVLSHLSKTNSQAEWFSLKGDPRLHIVSARGGHRWKMCAAMRAFENPLRFHVILMHSLPCTSLQASSLCNFNFPTNASFEMMARDILNLQPHPSP